jgi:hemerythrin superfamily protein
LAFSGFTEPREDDIMARATATESEEITADALGVLKRDHRLVEELFAEFDKAAEQQLDPLARRICKMLRIHAQIEEEIFYPAARHALANPGLVDEAHEEHAQAKRSIATIESLTSARPEFKDTVRTLALQIKHHVNEEEIELFNQLDRAKIDLTAVGIALAERRDTLMDVLGLHSDDEEGATQQRQLRESAQQTRSSARSQ